MCCIYSTNIIYVYHSYIPILAQASAMFSSSPFNAEGVKRPFQAVFQERQAKIECLAHGKIGNAVAVSKTFGDLSLQSLPARTLNMLEGSCLATAADLSATILPEHTRHLMLKPLSNRVFLLADPRPLLKVVGSREPIQEKFTLTPEALFTPALGQERLTEPVVKALLSMVSVFTASPPTPPRWTTELRSALSRWSNSGMNAHRLIARGAFLRLALLRQTADVGLDKKVQVTLGSMPAVTRVSTWDEFMALHSDEAAGDCVFPGPLFETRRDSRAIQSILLMLCSRNIAGMNGRMPYLVAWPELEAGSPMKLLTNELALAAPSHVSANDVEVAMTALNAMLGTGNLYQEYLDLGAYLQVSEYDPHAPAITNCWGKFGPVLAMPKFQTECMTWCLFSNKLTPMPEEAPETRTQLQSTFVTWWVLGWLLQLCMRFAILGNLEPYMLTPVLEHFQSADVNPSRIALDKFIAEQFSGQVEKPMQRHLE